MNVRGPCGEQAIPMASFYRLPGATPHLDTSLERDELITSIDLPSMPPRSHYLKTRDRNSYAVCAGVGGGGAGYRWIRRDPAKPGWHWAGGA